MKNYTKNTSETMEISYYAERAIQDELDRESHANITIVIISYLAMFVYVALMLGGFYSPTKFLVGTNKFMKETLKFPNSYIYRHS